MLQDLETRQDSVSVAEEPAYHGLRSVRAAPRFGVLRVVVLLAIASILGVGIYFGAERFVIRTQEAPRIVAATPSDSTTSPVSTPTAPATVPSPAVVAAPPPEQALKPVAPLPAERIVRAAPPAAKEQKPMATVAATKRSRADAPLGIVKKADTPSVAAPSRVRRPAEAKAPVPKIEPAPASSEETSAVVDKKVRPFTAEESAEAGYQRAARLLDQGRPDDALRQLRDALTARPTHIKARELAAGIELQNGHWREAEKLLEEGLRQTSNHYLFARMLARVYLDHGAEGKALAVMESALSSGSDDAEFSALLGLLYQRAGRPTDAVKAYERAATLEPNDGRIWLGFAISLEATAQWAAAKSAYRRAQENALAPSLARYAEQRLTALSDR
jgi:Tfp pilus assembly protein PilF